MIKYVIRPWLGNLVEKFFGFIFILIGIYLYGYENLGKYYYITTITEFLTMISLLGIPTYILKKNAKIFRAPFTYIIFYFTLFPLYFFISLNFLRDYPIEIIALTFFSSFLLGLCSIYLPILAIQNRNILFVLIKTLSIISKILVALFLVKYNYVGLLGGYFVCALLSFVLSFLLNPKIEFSIINPLDLLPYFGGAIVSSVWGSIDIWILKLFTGFEEIGIYRVCLKVVQTYQTIVDLDLDIIYRNLDKTKFRFILPIVFWGLFVLGTPIAGLIFKADIFLFTLVCFLLLLGRLFVVSSPKLRYQKIYEPQKFLRSLIIGCGLNIILNLLLGVYGIVGIAMATLISNIVFAFLPYVI